MGNCHGTTAGGDVIVDDKRAIKPNENPEGKPQSSSTHVNSHHDASSTKHEIEPTETETTRSHDSKETASTGASPQSNHDDKATECKMKRGNSSGGSSERLAASGASAGVLGDESSTSRRSMDVLRLSSMRNGLHANGDLTQAVVRLETPFGKPIEEIYDGVHDGPYLGEGVSGVVRLVTHRATKVQFACKVLDIGLIQTEAGLRQLREEISIMCQLDHPNIVRIEEVYESTNTIYLLQELCLGGDLFDRLDAQPDVHYTEGQCAKLIKQMVSAVRYLHSKGVIHRDLKLENFLFSTPACDSELKMIDFGLSKHFDLGDMHHEQVGTPYTCAPEVLKGLYNEKSDIWSLGVITYLLLSGETPFGGCYETDCMAEVRQNIIRGSFTFEPEDIWEGVSETSKLFVTRLLNVDPDKRPTAKEVQQDEWIKNYAAKAGSGLLGEKKLSPKIVNSLVNFKEYSEMRRLLSEVLSFTLLPGQIVELHEEFEKLDTSEGDGQITLATMKDVLMDSTGAGALGGLTEDEVEDIFEALKMNKNDSTICWHSFIAGALSQCNVDDRNLQLAFERLDTDRKGYITFDDLTDLLGHAPETLDSVKNMWTQSMQQCSCKSERIQYEDFLVLMKGQSRRKSDRPSKIWNPQIAASLHSELKEEYDDDDSDAEAATPAESKPPIEVEIAKGSNNYFRKRSKSFDDLSLTSSTDSPDLRRPSYQPRVRPSMAADGNVVEFITAAARGPLLANREQYKKHRDLRIALCEASKAFDMKTGALHATMVDKEMRSPHQGANLIMKRGSLAPPDLESAHKQAVFDAAVRRGGRHGYFKRAGMIGHRRKRTQSDVTGMLLTPAHETPIEETDES